MKLLSLSSQGIFGLLILASLPSFSHEIRNCQEAGVDLRSLVYPVQDNILQLNKGQITLYKFDQEEPAAAAMGVAIVMPVVVDDEYLTVACFSVGGFGDIDVKGAKVVQDKATQAWKIELKTKTYDESGTMKPAAPLKLSILSNDTESDLKVEN